MLLSSLHFFTLKKLLAMAGFIKLNRKMQFERLKFLSPLLQTIGYIHYQSKTSFNSLNPSFSFPSNIFQNNVAIFWDLDNKPPNSIPPYEAALKLKTAVSSFGAVQYMVAYANKHAFSYVPQVIREQRTQRKMLNQLENNGLIKPSEPYFCQVCGRKFHTNEKLVNHFKQIHEREQHKRLNKIESAKGSKRVKLVSMYTMKMHKYKNAAREVLTPKVGYGLADELKRAGFRVYMVSNKPEAADIALKDHMVEMMDKRRVGCLVLVSDDLDFLGVLKEAKLRCLKTVVVGDTDNGVLKRNADSAFSWKEILMGKAKKEAASVVGKWKDRDVLKRLEWTYNPELEKQNYSPIDAKEFQSKDADDIDWEEPQNREVGLDLLPFYCNLDSLRK